MQKHRRLIDFDCCPNCGDDIEVETTCEPPMVYDGDKVYCVAKCGVELSMSCDELDAWVTWNNESEM